MVNKVLLLTGVILFGVPPSVTANARQGHEHTS